MYQERAYRRYMGWDDGVCFKVQEKETDLWVALDAQSYGRYGGKLEDFILKEIKKLRRELEQYIIRDEGFYSSLVPYSVKKDAPLSVRKMAEAAAVAGVGPMAAVAGLFAQHVGEKILEKVQCKKLIVENGGDIFLYSHEPVTLSVFAGKSPLSEKIGLRLEPRGKLGVCTSSGTVGHSLSFGLADAVVVVCKDAVLADAYATAKCNRVKDKEDIDRVLATARKSFGILGILIVFDKYLGAWGDLELISLQA
ncbi:MAG: UPF0280 family protein [Clostridia bacterium]|nr:UPF0280 family protein [Clostridia bacterium]